METVKIENPNVASLPKHRKGISAALVIVVCLIVAHLFFYYVCGNPSNFDAKGHPIDNNIFGTLYQGGFVIPIVITLLLTVLALGVERIVALHKASGKGKVADFVIQAKELLRKSALVRYRDVENRNDLTSDEKASIVEKEIADTTALELPYMQQNLNVIATISSLGTLFGLLGTVLGMIRSFGAMANEGAPDSIALSLGISEALMNTAMGITTGALAIIVYNYFSSRVENITNAVDEVGFAIGQTFKDR